MFKDVDVSLHHCFDLMANFSIHRYLMSNTEGRLDGHEKAERHMEMVSIYIAIRYKTSTDHARRYFRFPDDFWTRVHDHTQVLTSHMDTEIGFPINGRPDHDILVPKFRDRFLELCEEVPTIGNGSVRVSESERYNNLSS